ncbi:hypothetical protein NH340_JMT03164 [Sarcoptes scabiei]|uniref:Uncharacterized protein n=1 Tax=Sarcoptes scabiei TaxID=52283 RepID=A0A132A437_SARSC|nr:hypothetical protein QR98_0042150 [Sarcoptes scabiei]UXI17221.1 hypothetical protein NH340_JMT03164 [Sarcoptes scabiei]
MQTDPILIEDDDDDDQIGLGKESSSKINIGNQDDEVEFTRNKLPDSQNINLMTDCSKLFQNNRNNDRNDDGDDDWEFDAPRD